MNDVVEVPEGYGHVLVVAFERQHPEARRLVEALGGRVVREQMTYEGGEIEYRSRLKRTLARLHLIRPA